MSLGGSANRTVDVPLSAFVVSSDGLVVVQPRLADGQPLPSWLRFDPATGKLVGRAPASARGVIQVVLTVRDSQGNAASTQVEIRLDDDGAPADAPAPADASKPVLPVRPQSLQRPGDATERLAARPALSEQLRHARLQQRGTVADRLAATPRGERATTRQG